MTQADDFTPQNALETALIAAARDEPGARIAFETAVLDAELWVAAPVGTDPTDETLRLLTVTPRGERPATAVFTARARAETAFPGALVLPWPGRDLLQAIQVNPAMLNPGSPYGARWSPPAMAALLGQTAPSAAERRPTHLAMPDALPPGLVEGLRLALGEDDAVRGAWLALARWSDTPEPGFLLQVRLAEGAVHLPALLQQAMDGVALDARLDVVTRVAAPGDRIGEGLEIVALR